MGNLKAGLLESFTSSSSAEKTPNYKFEDTEKVSQSEALAAIGW